MDKPPCAGDNPYNCPDVIYQRMQTSPKGINGRLVRAILFLGPDRVQWTGRLGDFPKGNQGTKCPIMWSLDGKMCRECDILEAVKEEKARED